MGGHNAMSLISLSKKLKNVQIKTKNVYIICMPNYFALLECKKILGFCKHQKLRKSNRYYTSVLREPLCHGPSDVKFL